MNTSSHLSFTDAQNEFLLNQLATDPMTKELRLFLKQDEHNQETNRKYKKKISIRKNCLFNCRNSSKDNIRCL